MYIPNDLVQRFQNDPMAKKTSLWSFMILGILLMLFAPENILSEYQYLKVAVDFVSSLVPSINKWAAHSPWPETTKLFFTYCWLTIPIQVVIIVIHKPSITRFINFYKLHTQFYRPIILISMTVIFLLLNYLYAVPYTESSITFDVNAYRSKLVQSLFGVLMSFGVANLVACVIWWVLNFRYIYFNNK